MSERRDVIYILMTMLGMVFVIVGACCWALRDGMGPRVVKSHGTLAWSHFFGEFWPAGLVIIAAGVGLWCLLPKGKARNLAR